MESLSAAAFLPFAPSFQGRGESSPFPTDRVRLAGFRALVAAHFDFIWRTLRRLGIPAADLDDAAQDVFVVAARRFDAIETGRERAFLMGVARRVVSTRRRTARRHPEQADDMLDELQAPVLDPAAESELRAARATLQRLLGSLRGDARAVFVLAELEELSMPEIAALLGIPLGTVSSRLRSARAAFRLAVKRHAARASFGD